jgi:bla regulator protein blaR1
MKTTRLRLLELGFLAALGLPHAVGVAVAAPAPPARTAQPSLTYVYLAADDHTSMSGDTRDLERVRGLAHGKRPVLWFRDAGQEYVVRDASVLAELDATWKPVEQLGAELGKLGARQGELGAQQGKLGARQGLLGTRLGTLAVRASVLDLCASNDRLSTADRAALAKQRAQLDTQQRALEQDMKALEPPMKQLSLQMEALGKEMKPLGDQMEVVSRKAEAELRALIRRAIASGAAKPIT